MTHLMCNISFNTSSLLVEGRAGRGFTTDFGKYANISDRLAVVLAYLDLIELSL
jgi:hypothetical protein